MKEIQELTRASQEMVDLVFQLRFLLTSISVSNPRHIRRYKVISHRPGDVNRSGELASLPPARDRPVSLNLRNDIFLWPTLAGGGVGAQDVSYAKVYAQARQTSVTEPLW